MYFALTIHSRSAITLKTELHVFTDASSNGYAACLRTTYQGGSIHVRLLCAKSRVAPVRQITFPRLELQGAALGSNVAEAVMRELNVKATNYFRTDSGTVLSWISSVKCRFHVFVVNRVTTILEVSNPEDWHHVPWNPQPCRRTLPRYPARRSSSDGSMDRVFSGSHPKHGLITPRSRNRPLKILKPVPNVGSERSPPQTTVSSITSRDSAHSFV